MAVFKVIATCIIIFTLAEVSIQAIDRIVVNNRIDSLAEVIKDEMARHNSIPDALAPMLEAELKSIADRSLTTVSIDWNYDHAIAVNGLPTTAPLNSANIRNYGESMTLVITVNSKMSTIMFGSPSVNDLSVSDVNMKPFHKVYSTFALRYLK